jgi:hypothetical protein
VGYLVETGLADLETVCVRVKGTVYYGNPSDDDVGIHKPILNAIKFLKLRKVLSVSRSFDSSMLWGNLRKRLS